jgi:multiple sugar transport system substrate-binding protein
MNYTTRITRVLLALILLLLAGCAGEARPLPEEEHIIVLWHAFTGAESQALQILTDQFNANNPYNVVLLTEYQQDIIAKISGAAVEHRPDLVVLWPKDLQAYITAGLIGATPDLSPAVRRERADLLPMAEALYSVNDTMLALPLGLATYMLYYNVDWLSDLAYTPETATWEDFRQTVCAATNPFGGQVGLGLPAHASSLLALVASGGAEIVGVDGFYNFADNAGQQTVLVLNEIFSSACGVVYSDISDGIDRLSHSSMAMLVESSLRLVEIDRAVIAGRNFRLGVSALPGPIGPGPTLWYGPGMVIVAPEGDRREAALNVLGWFFSNEAQAEWSVNTDYLPVRRSLIESRLETTGLKAVEVSLLELTLAAADQATWVAWPRFTDNMACRASLLRGLLSIGQGVEMPGAYIDTAVTACNTGVRP